VDADAYARIRALYEALVDLDATERERALAASDDDPVVIERVRAMLGQFGATQGLATPVMALMDALVGEGAAVGMTLGAWTLERKIGEGGMGTVYAARRSDGIYEQLAAVKLLRGVPSAVALDYLARERQILASLNHPNIARLLDGGTTPSGEPFLVMEFLDGQPIDRYCREKPHDLSALLRLLIPICEAVAYAHARLVVHCDLKPSNLLVRADGRPCLLDFGIARLLGEAERGQPSSISQRARAFTPGFASPEQESGGVVSTATDVYSLGRLIEHLLAAGGRKADAELCAVIARATAVDPGARYASAAALAAELQRYLDRQPLDALPPRLGYRSRKWLQRRWPWALAGALFALTVAGFTLQLARDHDRALAAEHAALAERDRAAAAEQSARQVSDFVVSILDGANPDAGGTEVPVSRLVEQALARIETELAGQPAVQAELYTTLAEVQVQLRAPAAAQASFERAVAIERTLARGLPLARLVLRLARHVRSNGSAAAAMTHAREALALYQTLGPEAPADQRQQAMRLLGQILMNTTETAEGLALLRAAVADAETLAPYGDDLAFALLDLGSGLRQLGDLEEAERHLRRSVALFHAGGAGAGESRVETVNAQEVLARLLITRKQFGEAEQLLRAALESRRVLHGAEDVSIPWSLSQLGAVLDADGRSLEALPMYAEAVALAERKLGADGVHHAVLLQNQARSQYRAGALVQAEAGYRRALIPLAREWGEDNAGVATLRTNLGQLLLAMGAHAEARQVLAAAERVLAAQQPGNPVDLAMTRLQLAEAHHRLGRSEEARRWLALTEPVELSKASPVFAERLRVQALLQSQGTDAAAIVEGFLAAEAAWDAALSPGDARGPLARLDRAEWLARRADAGAREEARALAGQILAEVDARIVPDSPWRQRITRLQSP
jgi:serine/threonine-protein kinase